MQRREDRRRGWYAADSRVTVALTPIFFISKPKSADGKTSDHLRNQAGFGGGADDEATKAELFRLSHAPSLLGRR